MFERSEFENGGFQFFLWLPSLCHALCPQSSNHTLDVFLWNLEKTKGFTLLSPRSTPYMQYLKGSYQCMVKLEGTNVVSRNVSCCQGFWYLSHDTTLICRKITFLNLTFIFNDTLHVILIITVEHGSHTEVYHSLYINECMLAVMEVHEEEIVWAWVCIPLPAFQWERVQTYS